MRAGRYSPGIRQDACGRLPLKATRQGKDRHMNESHKPEHAYPDDRERLCIEQSIAARLAEASDAGNVGLVRLSKIRLAALRFAYEGTTEQRSRLAAFDNSREQGSVDPVAVTEVVYGKEAPAEALQELFGVQDVTDDEADFFVTNVTADAWALQHGQGIEP
jgi:hypothetical protein